MKAEANSITIPSHLVDLLEPYAQQALMEINEALLLGTGIVSASGLVRSGDGDLSATWSLSWREQAERRIDPVTLRAFFGHAFLPAIAPCCRRSISQCPLFAAPERGRNEGHFSRLPIPRSTGRIP